MGLELTARRNILLNVDIRLYIDQIGEISRKTYILIKARPMWCQQDQFDPNMYNVGFKIVDITPVDREIYLKMYETYGSQNTSSLDGFDLPLG